MKKVILFLFVGFVFQYSMAQQPGQYSLYMMNQFSFNPAYAGMDNSISITGVYRKQWVGLEQSPATQNVNIHLPLYRLSGGIGINVENDNLGAERNTLATLSYAFQLPIKKIGLFAIGAGVGLYQKSLDGTLIRTPEGTYNPSVFDHNDQLNLPTQKATESTLTMNLGVYYQSETLEVGLSTINFLEPSIQSDFLNTQLSRNYFLVASYNLDLFTKISLRPSILLKTDQKEWQTEASLIAQYNNNIFIGTTFRGYNTNTIDAISFLVGLNLGEKIRLGYAYDYTISDLNIVTNGGHEILLNYNLGKEIGKGKLPKIIFNPRY